MSFFFLGFFNIFILNKFGICRDKKQKQKTSEYQEPAILLLSKT